MSLRTEQLYVTRDTLRDAKTAAFLAGLQSADEWAEVTLRAALDAIPALKEASDNIKAALDKARKEWRAKHQPQIS